MGFDNLIIDGFDWDEGNREKCQKHGVSIPEIESLFKNDLLMVFSGKKCSGTEKRLIAVGKTEGKRSILIVFAMRTEKQETTHCAPSVYAICTERRLRIMKKKLPTLKSDKDAEDFIENTDLTEYNLSGAKQVRFEFQRKDKAVTLRIPEGLLDEVKKTAAHERMPYQRFIRMALEKAIHTTK
ncbi:MAG: CopG family antitoxin [Candidatus Anammoxibacter sp.]